MKTLMMEQGSTEWQQARLGVVTASDIDDGYWQDLEDTVVIINRCLSPAFADYDFFYRSSW
jgi:hypothetical protein